MIYILKNIKMGQYNPLSIENDEFLMVQRTYEEVRDYKSNPLKPLKFYTTNWTRYKTVWSLNAYFIINFMLFLLFCTFSAAETNGCDFIGSGLEQDIHGVQPVYLKCAAGRIHWQYPRAALRILLRHPLPDREFQGCIRADPEMGSFKGARVYLEGHRSLLPILSKGDTRPEDALRCFTSHKGMAAIYVEAEGDQGNFHKNVAAFEYDLVPMPRGEIYNPTEECRPCSEKELVQQYCVADFVARGTILGVEDNQRQDFTTVHFRATKVYQQSQKIFSPDKSLKHSSKLSDKMFTQIESNLLSDDKPTFIEPKDVLSGKLQVPLHCGARAGPGEFLVIGNMRLGHPILKCAPRIEDWIQIAEKSKIDAPCLLET